MGLRNGPASFSRGMAFMSLDDVNVYSTRDDDNLSDDALFKNTNLCLNGKKCFIGESEIKFLKHLVSVNGIR
eukprot:gene42114-biopygen4695